MKCGEVLPNGAVLIAESGEIILAKHWGLQPWVTWRYRPGEYNSTGAGHYHADLLEAVQDFYERAGITVY